MPLGTLTFRARHNVDEPVDVDGGVVVRGEIEWITTGAAAELDALLSAVGDTFGERASDDTLLLRFGNAVGRFLVGGLGVLEVRCGKWDEETFDAMLEDLTRVALGLPFSSTQTASLPHDKALADRDDVLLHAFLYARHIVLTGCQLDALRPALEAILHDPHRRFLIERRRVPIAIARRADTRTLHRIGLGVEPLVTASGAARALPLARALGGKLPEAIDEPHAIHSVDTTENRFVWSVLRQILALTDRVESFAETKPATSFWRLLVRDCAHMRAVLAPYIRHDFWKAIGVMTHVPISSSVLQRRRGYKDVLRHHLALRAAARLPVEEPVLTKNLLGMKDVASLYELWCFFAVVRELQAILGTPESAGRPSSDEIQVGVDWGFRVTWKTGARVFYNLSFNRRATAERRSSSLLLRPDIVIQLPSTEGVVLHVLDAKLRVQAAASVEIIDDDEEDEALSFKRADVAKMHAYRDALPSVWSAFILYPGHETVFFPALDMDATEVDAVGAIPLMPGGTTAALHRWLLLLVGSQTGVVRDDSRVSSMRALRD